MFILVKDIVKIMSEMAPARLAEDWDNVGLQVGRYEKEVRVILCALDFPQKCWNRLRSSTQILS